MHIPTERWKILGTHDTCGGDERKNEYVNVYIRIHNIIQTILLSNAIIRTKYLQMIT